MVADASNFMYPRPCQQGEFVYVTSYEMMQTYPMAPGQTLFFVDVTKPIGYIRSRNYDPRLQDKIQRINMAPIEEEPIVPPAPVRESVPVSQDQPNYATVEQLNELNKKIDKLLSMNSKQSNYRRDNDKEASKHE